MATQKEMIQETHDTVLELKTVIIGLNGDDGLVGDVKKVCSEVLEVNNRHSKLSRNFWVLIGLLTGLGVIGGGATLLGG